MRVLMVHSFHHARGGDTTYGRELTAELTARGHSVIPLAMRHPDNDPSVWEARFPPWVELRNTDAQPISGPGLARAALGLIWSPAAARAAASLARDARPDVVHIQHLHRHLTPSILPALRRAGLPIVWTVHDYELVCPSGLLFAQGSPCERCRGHQYHHAVLNRCKWGRTAPSVAVAAEKWVHHQLGLWKMVDRFLCPSRYLADTLVRFGIPSRQVEHLPNFLRAPPPAPAGAAAGSAAGSAAAAGEGWLYAGRLTEEKGVQVALQAARHLPDQPLYVCGDGPMAAQLRRAAADLPWVHFLGPLSRQALARRLPTVRAVVVPSLWPENFPYAVIEAQAAARPVVASRIGGISEQIQDGESGLLVEPSDVAALTRSVASLLDDASLARRIGRCAQERVRSNLAPGPHVDRLVELYEDLVEQGRS